MLTRSNFFETSGISKAELLAFLRTCFRSLSVQRLMAGRKYSLARTAKK